MSYSVSASDRRHQARSELVFMSKLPLTRARLALGAALTLVVIGVALVAFMSVGG